MNDVFRFAARETARFVAAPDESGAELPHNRVSRALANLQRKLSSRLARHVALNRRRLVNSGPMVSFTFDDAAMSAGHAGAERLEKMHGRGTYYIASGLIGRNVCPYALMDRDSVRELHLKGHEIALHGHAHRAAGALTAQEFHDDLRKNREWLEAIDEGIRPTNFAYPYGFASFARKLQLCGLVASTRSVAPGVIAGDFDPQFLRCVELANQRVTPDTVSAYLDAAVRLNGWLIFCSHDIADDPSPYGCTPALFQHALDGAASRRIEIVTIAEALSRSHSVPTGPSISIEATRSHFA
ncbi:MAG: polysaccharide deacetylase family protein [Hyphomicrobiales bacterium]|nr:polysaccharide deacetylase family protein [Hyphomicrobiales bacterium]MBV8663084.1 polysaccharide deacetylase family protein [Hyphomicrobiales bacterium]